jgi:hypothetical protein
MKVSDFKLFATLPDGWEYEIFTFNNDLIVIGRNGSHIIGFKIEDDKLVQLQFENRLEEK